MRAQAAALYREHADREVELEGKQRASREEAEGLREERDALAIRASRLEEVLRVEDEAAEDPTAPHRSRWLGRRGGFAWLLPRTPHPKRGVSFCV